MNKRIGSVQTGKVGASKSRTALSSTVLYNDKKVLPYNLMIYFDKNYDNEKQKLPGGINYHAIIFKRIEGTKDRG